MLWWLWLFLLCYCQVNLTIVFNCWLVSSVCPVQNVKYWLTWPATAAVFHLPASLYYVDVCALSLLLIQLHCIFFLCLQFWSILFIDSEKATAVVIWMAQFRLTLLKIIVWRLGGNIMRTAVCWIVWHNVHSQQHTYVSSSYRSNRLGLSH